MYSPGTIMYQLGQTYNLRMIQLEPQLGETLWRSKCSTFRSLPRLERN